MSLPRQLARVSVTLTLVVSACSGFRLSPVRAEPTSQWIPGKFIWHDLVTHDVRVLGQVADELWARAAAGQRVG